MKKYAKADVEPSLTELLGDPIVDLVLARDRISRSELHAMIGAAQRTLRRTRPETAEMALRPTAAVGLSGRA
ncbi:MAG: hypothetical protein H7840_04930 [Alphaproteobacteria bacterium]